MIIHDFSSINALEIAILDFWFEINFKKVFSNVLLNYIVLMFTLLNNASNVVRRLCLLFFDRAERSKFYHKTSLHN